MRRSVTLPILTILLLVLAACSAPPEPTGPRGLTAVAGPHYAQLYWDAPAEGEFELQVRTVTVAGTGDWQPATDAVIDSAEKTALVPLPATGQAEYRLGVRHDDQMLWTLADDSLSRFDGVKLQVGTLDRDPADSLAGIAFIVWFDVPEETVSLQMTLSGPAGWAAGDHPVAVEEWEINRGYLLHYVLGAEALPGTYSLEATDSDGNTWSDTISFTDHEFRLPPPTDLELTVDMAAATATASWLPPVSDAFTQVALLPALEDGYASTFSSSHEFTDVDASVEYVLEVIASNALLEQEPVIMPVPFGATLRQLQPD